MTLKLNIYHETTIQKDTAPMSVYRLCNADYGAKVVITKSNISDVEGSLERLAHQFPGFKLRNAVADLDDLRITLLERTEGAVVTRYRPLKDEELTDYIKKFLECSNNK